MLLRITLAEVLETGLKEIVAVAGAPFKLTCCGFNVMVYPEIAGATSDRFTVLGIELAGAIVT
jgi:hypothetical protein